MNQGKAILFGEHFILYNCKALTIPLKKEITIKINESKENKITINFKKKDKIDKIIINNDLSLKALEQILKKLKISEKLSLEISTNLPINAGLGSSAGFSVALTKSLNKKYSLNLTEQQIISASMEAEKIIHGSTLGIDIFATLLQKPFFLSIKNQKLKIEKIEKKLNLNFILIFAQEKPNTKQVVDEIKQYSMHYKESFQIILKKYKNIIKNAENLFKQNDFTAEKLKMIGQLMNQNHELLRSLNLSTPNIEEIISIAMQNNAYGAKLTGAGKGGFVIILVDKKDQIRLSKLYEIKGYETMHIQI